MENCKCEDCSPKEKREIRIELNNPGTVVFSAPSKKCKDCSEIVFSEEDLDEVFDSFEAAVAKKHLK
jgi:hypothetical protein